MKVGATLSGMVQNFHPQTFRITTTLATRDATAIAFPGHPTFPDRGAAGIGFPYTSDRNGYFFKADTIEDLAEMIYAGNEYQRVPLRYLVETVNTWNSCVDAGADPKPWRGS